MLVQHLAAAAGGGTIVGRVPLLLLYQSTEVVCRQVEGHLLMKHHFQALLGFGWVAAAHGERLSVLYCMDGEEKVWPCTTKREEGVSSSTSNTSRAATRL